MQRAYFCVFVTGVLSSLLIIFLLSRVLPSQRKIQHFLSNDHFLQLRDDYSMFVPSSGHFIDEIRENSDPKSKGKTDVEDEIEALSSLKVAIELKSQGKAEKAMKLFKHALALAPKHPEILNKYGEFLEHDHSDIITADSMYFQVSRYIFDLKEEF